MTRWARAWIAEHRDWPADTWGMVVVTPVLLAAVYGLLLGDWRSGVGCLIFYVLGVCGHRVWVATRRVVHTRREVDLIRRRDGLDP